jgi:hypothetical protein
VKEMMQLGGRRRKSVSTRWKNFYKPNTGYLQQTNIGIKGGKKEGGGDFHSNFSLLYSEFSGQRSREVNLCVINRYDLTEGTSDFSA